MKQISLFFIFVTSCFVSIGQINHEVTINVEDVPMSHFIKTIEERSSFKFYYINSWIDSLKVSVNAEKKPIHEVLTTALRNSRLQFYIDGNKIILTDNTPILEGIDPGFFSINETDTDGLTNYSFRREYIPVAQVESKVENKIIEIGTKQATLKGNPTLVGYIKEKKTNEAISGAQIYVDKTSKGTSSNAAGFYSLTIPQGKFTLVIQYTGMNQERRNVILYSDGKLDVFMEEDVISLKEVVVESDRDANILNNQMGKSIIDMKSIKNVPKILGENDLLRVALTLPGVKSVGEGASGLNVRGGNADQNLMQLNEATIYNTSHFLGFFSVFNSDAIKTSELYKSGIPAQYGGRLSSIFDIQLKDGNQNKFSGTGGIGPVTAKLLIEVPVVNEKTSLVIGGRSTYSDWLLRQVPSSTVKNSSASFYDLVGRATHKFNENNSIAFSYYYSKDRFKLGNDSLFSYSNNMASLQWRSSFNHNLHSMLSITHSIYKYNIDFDKVPQNAFTLGFGIKESNVKWDFNYYKGAHKIDFGLQSKLYNLNPGFINASGNESIVKSNQVEPERGLESALYLADNIEITPKLSLYLGLRYSSFTALGARNIYSYSPDLPKDNSSVTDSTAYGHNESVHTYRGPEYRFSARYALAGLASVKISYNRTRQYIHMLSNTVSVSPTTTWKLSDTNVAPQLADQISLGFYKDIPNNSIETSVEIYYKWLDNVIDYKIGSELIMNKHIEQDILQGKGKAYGIEFLVRKKTGKLNGWVSYTYSRTFLKMNSQFMNEKINDGSYYPANYDKPH
ncbi:MAG: TonB-dependent receptor, partial [Chryseolinea sp.]